MMKRIRVNPSVFTQIWFIVEGQWVRFKCDHRAGWFRIAQVGDVMTEVICSYEKRHHVKSGFYREPPAPIAEPPPRWEGKPLRGEQLKLLFRGRPVKFPDFGGTP